MSGDVGEMGAALDRWFYTLLSLACWLWPYRMACSQMLIGVMWLFSSTASCPKGDAVTLYVACSGRRQMSEVGAEGHTAGTPTRARQQHSKNLPTIRSLLLIPLGLLHITLPGQYRTKIPDDPWGLKRLLPAVVE